MREWGAFPLPNFVLPPNPPPITNPEKEGKFKEMDTEKNHKIEVSSKRSKQKRQTDDFIEGVTPLNPNLFDLICVFEPLKFLAPPTSPVLAPLPP